MGNRWVAEVTLKGIFKIALIFTLIFFNSFIFIRQPFAKERKSQGEPIVITSQSLIADNRAKTALFEGTVIAKKGEITLFADKMLVYYSEEKGDSSIKKIEAEGNIKLVRDKRVITSRFASYFAEPDEKIVFTGEPVASDGENVIKGTKMIYFVKDDRSVVENSKVFLRTKN